MQEAHIAQLISQLEVLLSAQPISTADIVGLQGEASQLPGWAAHRAHMELGMRLNQKQRYEGDYCLYHPTQETGAMVPCS